MINRRIIFLFALAPAWLCGQTVKLDVLDKLADKASDSVTISLDGKLLQAASRLLSNDDPDQKEIRKLVASLRGVYVRNFQFEKSGEYQPSDLDPVRSQLKDPKWKKIVEVRGRDNAEVMLRQEDERTISGLAVIVAEAKELTVVYIDGPIDMDGLSKLAGTFGIPEDIGSKLEKDKDKDKEKKAK